VLVVDDNADAADALAQVLTLAGYHTQVAYNASQVLARRQRHISAPMPYCLILGYLICLVMSSRVGCERSLGAQVRS